MYQITVTKQMIAHEICGHLCGIAEWHQDGPAPIGKKIILIKKWNDKGPLTVTWDIVITGYHCYGGDDPSRTKIPSFISKNWDLSFLIYKKLKGL